MKYMVAVILGCCMALVLKNMVFAHNDPAAMICGDVNGDGVVLATDALYTLHRAVGLPVHLECNNRRN